MAADYRITVRVSEETADAFRGLAYEKAVTLGDMLERLIHSWNGKANNEELCAKLLALKFSNQ